MEQPITYYSGLRLIETTAITKQVQRRKHRKRRINKKWLKRYGYKTVLDDGNVIICGDCLFATPKTAKKLQAQLADQIMREEGYRKQSEGEWITDEEGYVTCSVCGEEHAWDEFRPPYCDMCGAKMKGGAGGDEKN